MLAADKGLSSAFLFGFLIVFSSCKPGSESEFITTSDCANGAWDSGTCQKCSWGSLDNPQGRCLTMQEDFDVDGLLVENDNCPLNFNRAQTDYDGDGEGNACDIFMAAKCQGVFKSFVDPVWGQAVVDMDDCVYVNTKEEAQGFSCAQVRNNFLYFNGPIGPSVWKIGPNCEKFDNTAILMWRENCLDENGITIKSVSCGVQECEMDPANPVCLP